MPLAPGGKTVVSHTSHAGDGLCSLMGEHGMVTNESGPPRNTARSPKVTIQGDHCWPWTNNGSGTCGTACRATLDDPLGMGSKAAATLASNGMGMVRPVPCRLGTNRRKLPAVREGRGNVSVNGEDVLLNIAKGANGRRTAHEPSGKTYTQSTANRHNELLAFAGN